MTSNDEQAMSAERFIARLETYRSEEKRADYERSLKSEDDPSDRFIGVRMGQVFALAKDFIEMPPGEIETLLESPIHEVRVGGLSIMDKQARRKKTPESRRKELYELYLRRHDRINSWDLVDVCCIHVVGGYLYDFGTSRDVLYELARSSNTWERRTAIVSTAYFIRKGELDDGFAIAELLLDDPHDLIHKATGWMLRFAGDKDRRRLESFLEQYAATMPRVALRYAIEHFDEAERRHYLGLKKAGQASGRGIHHDRPSTP